MSGEHEFSQVAQGTTLIAWRKTLTEASVHLIFVFDFVRGGAEYRGEGISGHSVALMGFPSSTTKLRSSSGELEPLIPSSHQVFHVLKDPTLGMHDKFLVAGSFLWTQTCGVVWFQSSLLCDFKVYSLFVFQARNPNVVTNIKTDRNFAKKSSENLLSWAIELSFSWVWVMVGRLSHEFEYWVQNKTNKKRQRLKARNLHIVKNIKKTGEYRKKLWKFTVLNHWVSPGYG